MMFYELALLEKLLVIIIVVFLYSTRIANFISVLATRFRCIQRAAMKRYTNISMFRIEKKSNNHISTKRDSSINNINNSSKEVLINSNKIEKKDLTKHKEVFKDHPAFMVDSYIESILNIVNSNKKSHQSINNVIEMLCQIHNLDDNHMVLDEYPEIHKFIFDRAITT